MQSITNSSQLGVVYYITEYKYKKGKIQNLILLRF